MANELKLRDHLHGDLALAALQGLNPVMQKMDEQKGSPYQLAGWKGTITMH